MSDARNADTEALIVALRYVAQPTMGYRSGVDPAEFVWVAEEAAVRHALATCIRMARTALSPKGEQFLETPDGAK
jgi:hypothetical protein